MNTARFLRALRDRGIELRADGDRIVVNAPKSALTEADGDEIRRRKTDLLAFLRMGAEGASGAAGDGRRIPKLQHPTAPDGSIEAPASFGQRRLFYLDQLEPGLAVYNVPVAFYLRGAVDVSALRAALTGIVERHAVLRTSLALSPAGVVQRIAPSASVELEIVDVEPADDDRLQALLTERACRPFDLTKGPLFRPTLLRLSPEESVLLVASHHVVTDGWSQDVFESELLELYEARVSGRPATLAPLAIQYADYAAWQTTGRTDVERDERLAYWKENLRAPLPILELPTTHARPNMAPTEGATASIVLPAELVEPLGALARRDGATLFMTLVAAYATLLHRISGQDEVIIGTPIANRTQSETLDLIGYFANTIALRIDLGGQPTFRELLRRVRDTCTGAYANMDVPFEELVEALEIQRDLSRSPIFQTIFAFEDAMPTPASRGAAAAQRTLSVVRRDTVHARVARTDLSAWVSASPEGLRITFEYPTALFDAPAVNRLLDHVQVLLRALADGADGPIDELPILSAETRRRILVEWNETERELPAVAAAHELFERQVDADGERVAVVMGDIALTYAALDRRANKLAHHLLALGVGRSALVGVFLERSPEMVVALLAILKTGAAYVPIDPEYPADRIVHMIEDAALERVVTSESLLERLPSSVRCVVVDEEANEIASRPSSRPQAPFERGRPSEDPAYVLYTSGSTGRPKGVVIPHRALVNFLASMARAPGLSATDTLLAVTTLSFDIAGLEMYLPLSVGAKMVIASADQAADGSALRELVETSGASFMQATPSSWRLLIAAGWRGAGTAFKALCGGEAFPPELAAQLLERATSVWNMYGPTETTIWSTCVKLEQADPRITIGRPIDNTSVYVLDRRGQPTPIGVPGELHIGGLGVARGYLRRPELTEARFVDDPFSPVAGRRLYRTGDLASFRDDGQLVYHRRLDHQVKVRGHRIELGEIESVLVDHGAVAQAVVIVREDRAGDARLVAYYVVNKGMDVTTTDLRKHLRRRLPEYMLPQHFVELPSLPLTPAGKIDRLKLPSPASSASADAARPPTTSAEVRLAAIWADVLGTSRIGATDNFFDLGGHSMLSMAVVARVQAELGARISPRDLLLSTLEHLAAQIGDVDPKAEAPGTSATPKGIPALPGSTPSNPQPSLTQSLVNKLKGKLFG